MTKHISLLLLSAIFFSCCPSVSVLDDVKDFRPSDKYFISGLKSLHFIIEVSSITLIDSIFVNMINDYDIPINAAGCADGIFIGESPYDAFDYKHVVELEIKDEKIIRVDYDEVNSENIGKEANEEYNRNMKAAGTTPSEAYPLYESNLIKKQNMMEVDAVSGASYSLYRFRYAVMAALMKARIEAAEN